MLIPADKNNSICRSVTVLDCIRNHAYQINCRHAIYQNQYMMQVNTKIIEFERYIIVLRSKKVKKLSTSRGQ